MIFFDMIFCGEVIEHLYDTDFFLEEVYRVLRPQGICVFTTPNLAAWHNRIILLLGFQPNYTKVSLKYNVGKIIKEKSGVGGGHIRVFTMKAFKELLRLHSFELLKIEGAIDPLFEKN